jgi:hypothetical protein
MYLQNALALAVATMAVPLLGSSVSSDHQPVSSLEVRQADEGPVADRPCMSGHNIQQITWFGERPSYRRDGQKIAFMSKSFGDAYEIDLRTQRIKLLTGWPHPGFLRAQYLVNGDLFMIGAPDFEDVVETRNSKMEMWILTPGERFVKPLNHKIWEGVAISIYTNKIAWANTHDQYPDEFSEGESAIFVADIDYSSGEPVLVNKKEVIRETAPECMLEPQDFFNNDTELTFSCYGTHPTHHYAWVESVHLETGERTILRQVEAQYNEVEGIFPNGKYTLVESDNSRKTNQTVSVAGTEIYRMSLEANSTLYERLTWFSSTPPWKAGNPVVSPDGRTMAVHSSRSDQQSGVGYGLYIVDLIY